MEQKKYLCYFVAKCLNLRYIDKNNSIYGAD